jgi:hypothetical protein
MKKIKKWFALITAAVLSFAACNYHGDEADSSGSSNGTPFGAGSSNGVATDNSNVVNPSLTDTLLSDSTNRDTLR